MTEAPDDQRPVPSPAFMRVWRPMLIGLGFVCVGLGIIGLFVPMMPGTVFLIAAAALFARSSPRFEAWLLEHPQLGHPIRAWRENGAIPPRIKWIAAASLVFSFGILAFTGAPLIILFPAGFTLLVVGIWIVTRPDG